MMLSPEARIDDGKLDVITASGLTRANVVTELSRIHTGGHVNNPKVTITQGHDRAYRNVSGAGCDAAGG